MAARGSLHKVLALCASGAVLSFGCNAILGIDEGHLVENGGSVGTGGDDNGGSDASATGGRGQSGTGGGTSGAGGTAAGGAATGGKAGASGGASGASGGAGGRASGGAAGASGAGGSTGPVGTPGEAQCGAVQCMLPGQGCCINKTTTESHCANSCDSATQVRLSCDGAEDCGTGEHCCLPTIGSTAACGATCIGRVLCGGDSDCLPGQYCAAGTGVLAAHFVCTDAPASGSIWCGGKPCDVSSGKGCCYDKATTKESCAATCTTGAVRFECDSDDDCGMGSACCESHTGLGIASGTSCITGTCPMGRAPVVCGGGDSCASPSLCCLTNGGTTCGANCTTERACGTDADCAAGESCTVVTASPNLATGRRHCVATP